MMMTTARLHRIGWTVILALCLAAFAVWSLSVQAVRNEVLLADIKLAQLEKKKHRLETEFQARASQHRLGRWNHVDLGYVAPRADQYLDGSRQLAALGQPARSSAPAPIRVARADLSARSTPRAMTSPLTGAPITLASVDAPHVAGGVFSEAVSSFLIQASPIREARAQSGATYIAEAVE